MVGASVACRSVSQRVVDHVAIEVELACVFGLEVTALELDHHMAAQLQVIEKQVDVELFIAHGEPVLEPHECKALPEFEQEFFQMTHQRRFQLPLVKAGLQGQEIKDVRVFERLLNQIGVRGRQPRRKIADRIALPLVRAARDLHLQHIAAPAF